MFKKKVRAALTNIIGKPMCGKPLKEELAGLRSYRLGKFRIVHRIANERLIEIVAIGPRKNIYEETYRLVQRETR
jgi:mRNA interferase RelE/StbE